MQALISCGTERRTVARRAIPAVSVWALAILTLFVSRGAGENELGEEGTDSGEELKTFVVVASRTPVPLESVSPSISVIHRREIEERQYQRLEEFLNTLPGLSLATTGQTGAVTSLFARGTNSDHTTFLLDGRKLNGGFSGSYNLSQISLDNVASVEVMRGASSTLYGAEGLGGVVSLRYDTASDAEERRATVRTEGGSFESHRHSLSGAWRAGWGSFSLGLSHQETANDEPNSPYRNTSLMPRLGVNLRKGVEIDLVGQYYRSDLGIPGNRKSFIYPALWDFQVTDTWMISPGLSARFSESLRAKIFYSRSRDRLEARNRRFFLHTVSFTRIDQADLQIDWSPSSELTVTTGVVYLNHDYLQENRLFGGHPFDDSWNSKSLYAQLQWRIGEQLSLTSGIRADDYSDFGSPTTWNLQLNREIPRLGIHLFGKVATAYATPQAIDLYGTFGNPDLNAEESESWEIGLKQSLFEDSLKVSAVFFRNDFVNLITGFPPENAGKALSEGLEMSIRYSPRGGLLFYGHYTYLTAENRDTGTRLARRPRHQGMMGIRLRPRDRLTGGLEYRLTGDREDLDGGTYVRIDGQDYAVARLYVNCQVARNLQIFGRIENLFNARYDIVDGYKALGRGAYLGARIGLF